MFHSALPPAESHRAHSPHSMTKLFWASHPLSAIRCGSKGHMELLTIMPCLSFGVIRATGLEGYHLKPSLSRPALSPFTEYGHSPKQMWKTSLQHHPASLSSEKQHMGLPSCGYCSPSLGCVLSFSGLFRAGGRGQARLCYGLAAKLPHSSLKRLLRQAVIFFYRKLCMGEC